MSNEERYRDTLEQIKQLLEAGGLTLDAVSARAMCIHALKGIQELVNKTLDEAEAPKRQYFVNPGWD